MKNKITIRPGDNWHWYFDSKYDCLMLEITSDMIFRSRYPAKMLIPDAFQSSQFSVDDASAYYQFYESCSALNLSEPQKVELVLNAIVANNFLKPQMPKSWYFIQQPMLFTPAFAEVVEAQTQDNAERINLLVVEAGSSASVCLIAQNDVSMVGKTFNITDVVKVMNDRLVSKNSTLIDNKNDNDDESELLMKLFHQECS
ncbi:cell division protein ZapC [Orbus wheelerorum]|uniref:cell division protein ZapC n=1 Tax=Orbus wheelerorum TaxID=3074111 RepID=UPI00370D1FC0